MKNKINTFSTHTSLQLTDYLGAVVDVDSSPFSPFSGFTFTPVFMAQDAPHAGEMHPDGDEVIFVFNGSIEVSLEFESELVINVTAGEGIVIPKGIWHRVHVVEPANMAIISPGPGFEFRSNPVG